MYYGARGIVGLVKPTYRPGSMESFIKLVPEGVGFIPAHAGIRAGNEQELQEALTVAEKKVARLANVSYLSLSSFSCSSWDLNFSQGFSLSTRAVNQA